MPPKDEHTHVDKYTKASTWSVHHVQDGLLAIHQSFPLMWDTALVSIGLSLEAAIHLKPYIDKFIETEKRNEIIHEKYCTVLAYGGAYCDACKRGTIEGEDHTLADSPGSQNTPEVQSDNKQE